MLRALAITMTVGSMLCLAPTNGSADVLSGYVQAQGGGATGVGFVGDLKDSAFHGEAEGLTYGFLIGVEIVLIDVWVEHNQYVRGTDFAGTWTQFMTGLDMQLDMGPTRGGTTLKNGRVKGGHSQYYGEFGIGLGFGVGTGQQVDPPLDNSELTDRGFIFQAQIGGGMRLNKLLSVGLSLPMQAGYILKADSPANDVETNYGSFQGALLVNARFKWQIK